MNIFQFLLQAPQSLVFGVLITIGVIVTIIPIALKFAGLSGAQIVDLLKTTLQFFLSMVEAYKAENSVKGKTD